MTRIAAAVLLLLLLTGCAAPTADTSPESSQAASASASVYVATSVAAAEKYMTQRTAPVYPGAPGWDGGNPTAVAVTWLQDVLDGDCAKADQLSVATAPNDPETMCDGELRTIQATALGVCGKLTVSTDAHFSASSQSTGLQWVGVYKSDHKYASDGNADMVRLNGNWRVIWDGGYTQALLAGINQAMADPTCSGVTGS
jgi:hypothetical protein